MAVEAWKCVHCPHLGMQTTTHCRGCDTRKH